MRGIPTSYHKTIAGAVARLDVNTRAARFKIYDRARELLMDEVRAADPPWQLLEVVREQRALEQAIEEVEAAYAERDERVEPAAERPREEDTGEAPIRSPVSPPPPDRAGRLGRPPLRPQRRAAARAHEPAPRFVGQPVWLWTGAAAVALVVVGLLALLLLPSSDDRVARAPEPKTKAELPERARLAQDFIRRGNELSHLRDYAGAIDAYTEAIRHAPNHPAAYNNRAYAHWNRGEIDRAIADYDQALRLEPDNVVALTNRAVAYNFRGDYELAVRDLDRALQLQPDNPDVLNSRCWGRALSGQLDAALADCNASLRHRPDDANTIDTRGFTYLKRGEYDRAIADFDAALRLDPKLVGSLYGRGLAKLRKGDNRGAETDIAAAKAIRPEIEAIFARYGMHR